MGYGYEFGLGSYFSFKSLDKEVFIMQSNADEFNDLDFEDEGFEEEVEIRLLNIANDLI